MSPLSPEELLAIAQDVFENNKEDVFYATVDGNFFPKQRDAQKHAEKIGSEVIPIQRNTLESILLRTAKSEEGEESEETDEGQTPEGSEVKTKKSKK